MVELADSGERGVFHVGGLQSMSRYDLASLLVAEVHQRAPHIAVSFEACKLSDISFLEKRPLNTSISTAKLRNTIAHQFTTMKSLARDVAAVHFAASS